MRTYGTSQTLDGKGWTWFEIRARPIYKQDMYVDEAGPTAGRYWMRGVRLGGVKEHSPRINGVSVDDTSMNWGFSFRKSFRRASARSACDGSGGMRQRGGSGPQEHTLTKRSYLENTGDAY
jgi:hypothetical protein